MSHSGAIKILHVLGRMNRGGAETRLLDLMRHIDRSTYKFEFCCLSGLPGELDDEVRSLGGNVHLLKLGTSFPFDFRKLLRRSGFRVVHSSVHWPSGYILRLAAAERVPLRVCQFASTNDGKKLSPLRRLRNKVLRKWVDSYATNILGVSEGTLTANWGPEWVEDCRFQVVYRGIDTSTVENAGRSDTVRRELGVPQDATIVIHVGRMDSPKNHPRLIAIFGRLLKQLNNAYLLLVGAIREPVYSEIVRLVGQYGLGSRVIIVGVRDDIANLLHASDVMIFPSLWEGLPGAVLEALAAGVPVLASDLPGIEEIAVHLPGIRTMSLDRSDEEWAAAAAHYRQYFSDPVDFRGVLEASPFTMRRAVQAYERLYSSAA